MYLMNVDKQIICPECGADMVLRKSRHGLFWGCSRWPKCDATHGAHRDGRPLGIPGDKATKVARQRAHAAFDVLWKRPRARMTRPIAYGWLAGMLDMTEAECHIGRFDLATCNRVVEVCQSCT